MAVYSVAEISQRLADQAESVCMMLLPGGSRKGNLWEVGDVTGGPGKSCKVNLSGTHVGKWRDWADSADTSRGDLVDLWEAVRGISKLEALRQIREYLGISDGLSPETTRKTYSRPSVRDTHTSLSPEGKVMQYLTIERKLEPSIINRFKVHADKRGFIVYPRYSPEGELLNNQYIGLVRDEKGKKKVHQETGCAPSLFGWHGLSDRAFTRREVLICEGEIDCMTWTQWGIDALSIPNGSGQTWIEYEWSNLEAFSTIYLSLDMDGKSDENLRKCIARLGLHRCRIVKLPRKDANDCLKAGHTAEEAQAWVRESKWPDCKGLVDATAFHQAVIDEFFPPPDHLKRGWRPEILQRADGGIEFLPGDVTVWTGVSSHGKSTFLSWLMTEALSGRGEAVAIASMEMRPAKIIARMIRTFARSPRVNRQQIELGLSMLQNRLLFVDRMGYIEQADLFEIMQFAFARYGVSQFVVDSMMRVNGLEEDYPAQGDFLNRLQEFSKRTDAHVHLVCHPRKTAEGATLGKMDIKGSSLILNNADNVVTVRKNVEKSAIAKMRPLTPEESVEMWDTMISSEKQRESGWEGSVALRFNAETFSFHPFVPPAVHTIPTGQPSNPPKRSRSFAGAGR